MIGIDPGLLFLFQFLSVKQYAGQEQRIDLLPVRVEDLPPKLEAFDTTFSMGVLYHRRSPLDHLLELKDTLRPGGELVLETLIADGPEGYSLMPEDRYGRMRNVWFLPSCDTLLRWLDRTGFRNARVVDVTETTIEEQRSTDWMQFQSLQDFLDPDDPTKTVEGYPGPKRATVIADKPEGVRDNPGRLLAEGVAQNDRLYPVRTGGNDIDRCFDLLFQETDIGPGVLR